MNGTGNLLLLGGEDVRIALAKREPEIIQIVKAAYETHLDGHTNLPNSVFLHPPDKKDRRIIALPAWMDGTRPVAGIKWIASFPSNHRLNLERASAVIVLNSAETGVPEAIVEGSIVSAKRTAASAALASSFLTRDQSTKSAGLIGCGPINFEILRFLRAVHPELKTVFLFDIHQDRAERFLRKCREIAPEIDGSVTARMTDVFDRTSLISFATTAPVPHVDPITRFRPDTTILHISLRDLAPETILAGENVVDDIDHVCRAQTSIHLTEQSAGHRNFIRCTLAEITSRRTPAHGESAGAGLTIFSPFGLGILDLAVARLVTDRALEKNLGQTVKSFLPQPWTDRAEM
jgi:2,3-diaminopropionate biosynthesis protein SbnB